MKVLLSGCTRIVIVLNNVVVKVSKPYIWRHFLSGLIANISERNTWRWNSGKYEDGKSHLLCPVVWASRGGWILVMKRADIAGFRKLTDGWDIVIHEQLYKP